MLNVLITVDTEVYPLSHDWRADGLRRDLDRDVYGKTAFSEYGLCYQMEVLSGLRLKGVFFVESLFASAVGLTPLERIVAEIAHRRHEIQLHLHPEWLAWMDSPPIVPARRQLMNQFSRIEQAELVRLGMKNLNAAGAGQIQAFRAGDYAADENTLHALAENGIVFDSSYNFCYEEAYSSSYADVPGFHAMTTPALLHGVCEVPVTYWQTRPFGYRHAQIAAASIGEMKAALWYAYEQGWRTFVIVSHSFELLKNRRANIDRVLPDPAVEKRFYQLCRFLRCNRESFQTVGFGDLDYASLVDAPVASPLASPLWRTASRMFQQALRRF